MFKFIITLQIKPGALETIREAAKPCQIATRKESGCISYDFYTSLDNPEAMVFVECFDNEAAHADHSDQAYVKEFLAIARPLFVSSKREIIAVAE